jgi:hypothetical protein
MAKEIALSQEAQSLRKGVYGHFKGDEILVVGIALHSETQEEMVVYRHVTGERAGEPYFWVRPVAMFLENVDKPDYKGPRFRFLREA